MTCHEFVVYFGPMMYAGSILAILALFKVIQKWQCCVYAYHNQCTSTCRYLGGKSSNMALVDVEIPSGYTFSQYEFEDDIVSNA